MSSFTLSDEPELVETKPFSVVALIAFLVSLVGLSSIAYLPLVFISCAAIGLGFLAKFLSLRRDMTMVSHLFAWLAVGIGIGSVAAGVWARSISTETDLVFAKKTAEQFLEHARKGDYDRLSLISSANISDQLFENRQPSETEIFELRKRQLRSDKVLEDILKQSTNPKWTFVKLDSEVRLANEHAYNLIYQDESRNTPVQYKLTIKRSTPKAGVVTRDSELPESAYQVFWSVSSYGLAK